MKVLLVKMSSLGDVVHTFPAVTDAFAASDALELHWAVEQAFVPVVALHPGVARVIPVRWRSARGGIGTAFRELSSLRRTLRANDYDLVLDAQGLIKSAAVVAMSGAARSAGFDSRSAREGVASLMYGRRIPVPVEQHAIDRVRQLFAQALGYPLRAGCDFGLPRAVSRDGGLVLLHGSTWVNKVWPEPFWVDLAGAAIASGVGVTIPWGNAGERARAERIAARAAGCVVAPALEIADLAALLSRAYAVVTVDSGLGHLAAALGVPVLGLFGPTSVARTGLRGAVVSNLGSDFPCAPCLARRCVYRGPPVPFVHPHDDLRGATNVSPPCFSRTPPERVWADLKKLVPLTGPDR